LKISLNKLLKRLEGAEASILLLEGALKDFMGLSDNAKLINILFIQQVVAAAYDLKIADLRGKRRPQIISDARALAMCLCVEYSIGGTRDIGLAFGGRHHTTVVHARRRAISFKSHPVFGQRYTECKKVLDDHFLKIIKK
jgi:chromosomal replication initiator protein